MDMVVQRMWILRVSLTIVENLLSLSSAREIAAKSIWREQKRYKSQYDKKQVTVDLEIGDWVFVRFPQEESGRYWKLLVLTELFPLITQTCQW